MSEKWTKGPWRRIGWHILGSDNSVIASVVPWDPSGCRAEDNDNGNLISAAPEMYDLIGALLEYIDAIPSEVAAKFPTMPGISRDWVEAVAAKARGES